MMNISITIMIKSLIRMILSFNISNIYIYIFIISGILIFVLKINLIKNLLILNKNRIIS